MSRRLIFALLPILLLAPAILRAAEGRVLKVLPSLLDERGRQSLAPSLYERDAYQAVLRAQPQRVSGMRFDVLWKARNSGTNALTLRLELRGATNVARPVILERAVTPGWRGRRWTRISLTGEEFRGVGEISAWRASLLSSGQELAELKSFLW
jgi:hypothetical protein